MTINNQQSRSIKPTHPGAMIREDFMQDYALSVASLAEALGVSRQTINDLIRERRALSASLALRLARFFGNSPEFWLNAQRALDLWEAKKTYHKELEKIAPINAA